METKTNLSARWTHAEKEGILTDRLGHGDISHWARGTSAARRPEVGQVERVKRPIRKLSAVHPVDCKPDRHNGQGIELIGAHVTDNGSTIMAHRAERIVPIAARFADHYKATVKRVGHEMKEEQMPLESIKPEALANWLLTNGGGNKPWC
jgi:hypothetical protein